MNKFLIGGLVSVAAAAVYGFCKSDVEDISVDVKKATDIQSDDYISKEQVCTAKGTEETSVKKSRMCEVSTNPPNIEATLKSAQETPDEMFPDTHMSAPAVANVKSHPSVTYEVEKLWTDMKARNVLDCPKCIETNDGFKYIFSNNDKEVTLTIANKDGVWNYEWTSESSSLILTVPLLDITNPNFSESIANFAENYVALTA